MHLQYHTSEENTSTKDRTQDTGGTSRCSTSNIPVDDTESHQ